MANRIEVANLRNDRFVSTLSRYNNSTIVYYGDDKKITFDTYRRTPDVRSDQDKFMVITKGYEYRPDLVSQEMYGVVDFWWRIMEVNNIYDIFDFKAGVNIRLPGNVFV